MERISITIASAGERRTQGHTTGGERMAREMMHFMHPVVAVRGNVWRPSLDILEGPGEILLLVELAGVRKEDLGIEIHQGNVRIHGIRREWLPPPEGRYHRAEIAYGGFERVVKLPSTADAEGIEARFSEGLLSIRIPLRTPPPKRRISIQRG